MTALALHVADGLPDAPLDLTWIPDAIDTAMEELTYAIATWHDHAKDHNADGWLAYEAGSSECLAQGHREPPDGWDSDTRTFDAGGELVDLHPWGWDDAVMCRATAYGVACTFCEAECELPALPVLWNRPGVMAA